MPINFEDRSHTNDKFNLVGELEVLEQGFSLENFKIKPKQDRQKMLAELIMFQVDNAKKFAELAFSDENKDKEALIIKALAIKRVVEKIKRSLGSLEGLERYALHEEDEILLGNRLAPDLKEDLEKFNKILDNIKTNQI